MPKYPVFPVPLEKAKILPVGSFQFLPKRNRVAKAMMEPKMYKKMGKKATLTFISTLMVADKTTIGPMI